MDILGCPDSSAGEEFACNAGDPGSIPGSGSSPGEATGYPLQCSWAPLVAQTVQNPPAMRETWARSPGRKIPWRRAWQPLQHSCPENPMDRGAWQAPVHGVAKSQT